VGRQLLFATARRRFACRRAFALVAAFAVVRPASVTRYFPPVLRILTGMIKLTNLTPVFRPIARIAESLISGRESVPDEPQVERDSRQAADGCAVFTSVAVDVINSETFD